MDSDDIMPTEKLKSMSQELINHGRGYVSIGIVKYFSDSGISDGYHKYESWLNRLTLSGTNYNEIYKEWKKIMGFSDEEINSKTDQNQTKTMPKG